MGSGAGIIIQEIVDLRECPELTPEIARYHHDEWGELNPGQRLEDRVRAMEVYLENKLIPTMFVMLLREKGDAEQPVRFAGTAALIACDMDTHPELSPWLASVFVLPEYRRQGIGSALVEHAMAQAGAGGIGELFLFTPDQEAFYQRLGWHKSSSERYRDIYVSVMQARLRGR
ncbi:MAG: GNAT family N-acetyltransferase [Ketobacteraceae bacterium]|nr:GNAT family N-acetyltransferase [Ketobacteraceae bacterium]